MAEDNDRAGAREASVGYPGSLPHPAPAPENKSAEAERDPGADQPEPEMKREAGQSRQAQWMVPESGGDPKGIHSILGPGPL